MINLESKAEVNWKHLFERTLGDKSLKFFENKYPKKEYLLGEEKTKENIDWRRAFIHAFKIIDANKKFVLANKKFPGNNVLDKLLVGVELSNQGINYANLKGANFMKAKFHNIAFININLSNANFSKAKISGISRFSYSNFSEANFFQVDFSDRLIIFLNCNLAKVDFTNAFGCKNCFFNSSEFTDTILKGFDISEAKFHQSFYIENSVRKPLTLEYLKEKGAIWNESKPPKIS